MKQKIKSKLIYIFQPAAIIYYVALFNFGFFWIEGHSGGGGSCLVCAWYLPWSYTNEPSIILAASLFLLLERWWSYLVSIVLSGYLLGYFIHVFMSVDTTLREVFNQLSDPGTDILTAWETQHFFALIILCFALFYLVRIYYIKVTKRGYL